MNTAIHKETRPNGYTVEMHIDEMNGNPREEWDHFGTIIGEGKYSHLTDKEKDPYDELEKVIRINFSSFSGYIYATHDQIRKEYGKKRLSQKTKRLAESLLLAEMKEFNAWLEGEVYGYIVKDSYGEIADSCWGYYGPDEYDRALEEARNIADGYLQTATA